MDCEAILKEIFSKLDHCYPKQNRFHIECKDIKYYENEKYAECCITVKTNRQRQKIAKLQAESICIVYGDYKSEEEVKIHIIIEEDIDVDNLFKKKESSIHYDNTDEMWQLYMLANNEIKKTSSGYYLNDIELSGDTVFNFNSTKCKYYEEIIKSDQLYNNIEKEYFKDMLKECNKFHHSPQNTSIIIKTGGLNNFKQGFANDRYDAFISEINTYFKGDDICILENGCTSNMSFSNRECLEKTLILINKNNDGLNEFVRIFYHLSDETFLNDLLKSGKKRIKNCKGLFRYMSLAFRYWILVSTYYCTLSNECRDKYLDMENSLPPGIIYIIYSLHIERINPLLKRLNIKITK